MDIRLAVPADAGALASLACAFRNHLGRMHPSNTQLREGIARLLADDDAAFLIARDGDAAAGYVLLRYRYSMWAGGTEATIEDLFVDPAVRRSGIGRALIRHALEHAGRRGCVSACLDTNENNVASTRIYTQLGFRAVSQRWNGRQIFYRLQLAQALAA